MVDWFLSQCYMMTPLCWLWCRWWIGLCQCVIWWHHCVTVLYDDTTVLIVILTVDWSLCVIWWNHCADCDVDSGLVSVTVLYDDTTVSQCYIVTPLCWLWCRWWIGLCVFSNDTSVLMVILTVDWSLSVIWWNHCAHCDVDGGFVSVC